MDHYYNKLGDDYNIKRCPNNDIDGKITGKIILNLPGYFDENPEERIALGWTRVNTYDKKDVEYNIHSQMLITGTRKIDDYTVEEYPIIIDKSPAMMAAEEYEGFGIWIVGR